MAFQDDLEKQNELLQIQAELQAKLNRLRGEEISKNQEKIALNRAQAESAEVLLNISKMTFANQTEADDFIRRRDDFLEKEVNRGRITLEQKQTEIDLIKQITDAQVSGNTVLLKQLQDQLEAQIEINKEIMQAVKAAASLGNNLARIVGFNDQAVRLGKSLGAAFKKPGEFAKAFANEVGELVSPAGVLGMFISNTVLLSTSLMKQRADFVASTGIIDDYSNQINALKDQFGELLSFTDIYPQLAALNQGFIGFNNLTDELKNKMAQATIAMEKFGVPVRQSADLMNELAKSAMIAEEDVADSLLSIAGIATETSFPLQEIANAMAATVDRLSIFGPRGQIIFGQLATSAKSMGFRVEEGTQALLQMVEGFDTFESAASKVANINAFLGGSFIDTYSMVMAAAEGPAAQLSLLESALNSAGITAENFGDNYYQAAGLADTFGISQEKLRKFLSGTVSEQELFMTDQEKMNKLLAEAVDPLNKLSNAVQELSVLVVELKDPLATIISGVANFIEFMGTGAGKVLLFTYGILGMAKSVGILSTAASALLVKFALIPAVVYAMYEGLKALGLAAEYAGLMIGGLIGAAGGAKIGASIGSAVAPGVGTAVGALVGGGVGYLMAGGLDDSKAPQPSGVRLDDGLIQTQNGRTKITPFHSKDQVFEVAKPGGSIDQLAAQKVASLSSTSVASDNSTMQRAFALMSEFIEASKSNQNRPIRIESKVEMPNGRVLAEVVNNENDRRFDMSKYGG